jgi:hypothetical protein
MKCIEGDPLSWIHFLQRMFNMLHELLFNIFLLMICVLYVLFPSCRQSLNPIHVPLNLYVGGTEHANEVNIIFILLKAKDVHCFTDQNGRVLVISY